MIVHPRLSPKLQPIGPPWDRSNIVIVARIKHNDDIRKALYRVREWVIVKRLAAASLALSSLSSILSPSLLKEPWAENPPPFNSLPHSSHPRARPYFRLPFVHPLVLQPRPPSPYIRPTSGRSFNSTPCAIHAVPSAVVAPSGAV